MKRRASYPSVNKLASEGSSSPHHGPSKMPRNDLADEEVAELPVDMMLEIISRTRSPIKSLARFKCVSKEWCKLIANPPLLGITHTQEEPIPLQICVDLDLKMATHDPKNKMIFELHSENRRVIRFPSLRPLKSCCYGLLLFRIYRREAPDLPASYIVTHPLRKEKYELPPLETTTSSRPSRTAVGLGFDHSTNTFKVVKVLLNIKDLDMRENSRAMVHVVGTRSWREIPNVLPHPLIHGLDKAIFAHGFVYWFTKLASGENKVICFDVAKEEFGSIDPPPTKATFYFRTPFDLNGDLGVAYSYSCENSIEVFVMKDKVWKIHCRIDGGKLPALPPSSSIFFRGIWNKEGDILCQQGRKDGYFVFGLTGGLRRMEKILVDVRVQCHLIHMYTPNLFSINPITPKSNHPSP